MITRKIGIAFGLLLAAASIPVQAADGGAATVDFARDIEPVLAKKCYECHGAEKRKGGLRLDLKQDAFLGGDSGPVIVPGKSAASKLIELISKEDGKTGMPAKGDRLTPEQIAKFRAWIDAGAIWPDGLGAGSQITHWAFKPIQHPAPPMVRNAKGTVRNPIDNFVLARLEKEGIKPSPEADRYTLIRRLSLDLLGLPPTLEEVEAFVKDKRPDAYEKLVDRLLASPHFGERWARHWLDVARYADSDGYEKDRPRPFAYLFRDWVIKAINDDLPFDQFSIQQLAGDLLPNATDAQKAATGFHRQTLTNTEGGTDQEEFRCKAVVDRVSTTATVWLGLTMACAECHTHKYDPITQREFYEMFAFFNNASEKNIPAPQPKEQTEYQAAKAKWDADHAKLKAAYDTYVKEQLPAQFAEWEKTAATNASATPWSVLKPAKAIAAQAAELVIQKDDSILSQGDLPDKETYTVEAPVSLTRLTGVRLEVMDDPDPKKGPGRAKDGNFVLTHFQVKALLPDGTEQGIALEKPVADFSQNRFEVANALRGSAATGWAISPKLNESHVAVFATREAVTLPVGSRLSVTLDHQYKKAYLVRQFRLSVTDSPPPFQADFTPLEVAVALSHPTGERTDKDRTALSNYHRDHVDAEAKKLKAALDESTKKAPVAPATFIAEITEESAGRDTRIHIRGNFLDRGAQVKPGTPSVLPPFHARGERADRLDLANWLFDPANPLTARVTVNQLWKNLFGRGLVNTVDDFGTRGDQPTHPELLDWLAGEFPKRNWSRKEMIRLIVTSATYRQSSTVRPELVTRDPLNTLLARQNRLRLEAETVRDASLAVSGLLNQEIGGPSIKPALPADIAALGYANSVKWQESPGTEKNRRGLYIFFQRTVPYPMLMTFDAPDSNATCTRRERSNTPLQALTLLNDPVFYECAQSLGKSMADVPTSDVAEKIRQGFEMGLARPPSAEELKRLEQLHTAQLQKLQADPESAARIIGAKAPDAETPVKASWTAMARVILNLDEFITRE